MHQKHRKNIFLIPPNSGPVFSSAIRCVALNGLFLVLTGCPIDFENEAIADTPSALAPVVGCTSVNPEATLSRDELSQLIHIAPGNSGDAMRDRFGLPHCWTNTTEWFPLESDPYTWIGLVYENATYTGYEFSAENYPVN